MNCRVEWSAPDFGGAIYLWGENEMTQAIVGPDPTGDTDGYFWSITIDQYGTMIAHDWVDSEDEGKIAAEIALRKYESEKKSK